MQKNNIKYTKLILSSCLLALLPFLLVSCNNDTSFSKLELKMALPEEKVKYVDDIVDSFNKENDDYSISLIKMSSVEEIKYTQTRNQIDPDFILLNNLNDSNYLFSDILAPLNSYEFVGDYQSNIISYLKDKDDDLLVIPGLGYLYTECYNETLLQENSIKLPESMDELKALALRLKSTKKNPKVCQGGKEFILSTLLEVSSPSYFSRTKGINFLNNYYEGKTSIESDSEAFKYLEEAFRNYILLFRNGYFDINDYTKSVDEAVNEFLYTKDCYSILNTPSAILSDPNENTATFCLYPFVGEDINSTYVASLPSFYLGASKTSIASRDKKKGIIEFFEYMTSDKGQDILKNFDINDSKGFISYKKDVDLEIKNISRYLKDTLIHGRNYLADSYISIFENFTDEIYEYILANVSGNGEDFKTLANKLDKKNKEVIAQQNKIYTINTSFSFDKLQGYHENNFYNFTADSIKEQENVTIAIISASVIQNNLFAGNLYDYELDVIYKNMDGYKVKISGATLKKIILDNLYNDIDKNPIISGIRLSGSKDDIEIKTLDKQSISDSKLYYAYLTEDYYERYKDEIDSAIKTNSITKNIRAYFNTHEIITPEIDNRYNNLI